MPSPSSIKDYIARLTDAAPGQEISAVLEILDKRERKLLRDRLGHIDHSPDDVDDFNIADITIKLETINALIIIMSENAVLKRQIGNDADNKKLLRKLHAIAYELSKAIIDVNSPEEEVERLYQLAMHGFLADRHSEVSPYLDRVSEQIDSWAMSSAISTSNLESTLYGLVILITRVIRTSYDKQHVISAMDSLRQGFDTLQNSNFSKEENSTELAYRIAAAGNVIHLMENVVDFLFTGNNRDGDSIYSLIGSYSFNIITLYEKCGMSKEENLSYILKYYLDQLCRNSIWNIADRSPVLADFFNNCISSTDNILYTMLPPQRDNVLDILTVRKSVVVNMPTSAGKSLLAELNIIFTLYSNADPTNQNRPTVCYVVPTNALINQVKQKLNKNFAGLGYNIDGVLPFFELDPIEDELLTRRHIDVLVTTPEKLDSLLRRDHTAIKNLRLMVLDEAHNIGEKERGAKMELLLAAVKKTKPDCRFLLMSPFVDNAKEIAKWLGDTDQDSVALSYEWTPTKQYIGCSLIQRDNKRVAINYFPSGRDHLIEEPLELTIFDSSRNIKHSTFIDDVTDSSIALISKKYSQIGNILVVCRGPGSAEKMAMKLNGYLSENGFVNIEDSRVEDAIALVSLELGQDSPLVGLLRRGIAYHHSQLPASVKEEIEELIRSGLVRVVCATTTLAQGMNFPITTVLFKDLKVGGGADTADIDNTLFWNIAGRAGRAYMDTEGHIVLINKTSQTQSSIKEITHQYIRHDLSQISSTLTQFFKTVDSQVEFNKELIENHAGISSFLQYLNHLIRVSYNYDFQSLDTIKLRSLLSNSLAFSEIEFTDGFMEAQQQILGFSRSYVNQIKNKSTGQLTLADLFGISDISLSRFYGLIEGMKEEMVEIYEGLDTTEGIKASNLILEEKNEQKLSHIVKILSKIPELKVYLQGAGSLNPESIARVIIGWVNGETVNQIASSIQYEGQDASKIVAMCHKYINGRLRTFVPWGMSIYQQLTDDLQADDAKNLPSYIYFGVNNKNDVVLSAAGVPRFALKELKEIYSSRYGTENLSPSNLDAVKENLRNLDLSDARVGQMNPETLKRYIDKGIS